MPALCWSRAAQLSTIAYINAYSYTLIGNFSCTPSDWKNLDRLDTVPQALHTAYINFQPLLSS